MPTFILRGAVVCIGLAVLAICLFVLPGAITSDGAEGYRLILLGMYLSAIPFFMALYQTLKLLGYIDSHKVFSHMSVKALKIIQYCAVTIGILYLAGLPSIYHVAEKVDAPGVLAMGCMVVFVSFVIATAANLLQKLLQTAIDIKSENDLTV